MWNKTLLAQACALALATPLLVLADDEFCLGNLYEEGMEVPGITPPTAKIVRNTYMPTLQAKDTVKLQAQATTDGGQVLYFWCIKTADGSPAGTLEVVDTDFSSIKYIAPNAINTEQAARLILRVADSQGYATGTSMYLLLQKSLITIPKYDIAVLLKDSTDKFIIGATLKITIDGEVVTITDEDNDGKYPISQIPEGEYNVKITKEGHTYPNQTMTIGTETDITLTIDSSVFPPDEEITSQNLVIVGSYACENNTISIHDPESGSLFHRLNPNIDARGIYISAVDFNHDDLTDIAVGGIKKGKEMLLYNTNREQLGKIVTNGDDKGVLIAFGDLDGNDNGDFEIFVTNQSKDKSVNMYESTGTAIRSLKVLSKSEKIRIATGDTDGDGIDELIVVLAEKTKDENVLLFDQNGTLLSSFNASPNDDKNKNKTYGLVVTVADVDGDGKDEIIVAEADKKSRYGVAIYDRDGNLQKRFNAFSGKKEKTSQTDDDGYKYPKCKNTSYKGKGLILSSGDVDGDNKADIIVARAGYRNVKLFNGDGQLINWFTAAEQGYQITALSFGEHIGIKLPDTDIDVTTGDVLDNVTIQGKPGKARPEIHGKKIRGTVRLGNLLIFEISIEPGAQLIAGLGVRFNTRLSIPVDLDLSHTCHKKKKKHKKLKKGKKSKYRTTTISNTQDTSEDIEVLDLSTPVVDNSPSVMEDIQLLLGDGVSARRIGLRSDNGAQIYQNPVDGNIEMHQADTLIKVAPVSMKQAAIDAPTGVVIDPDGMGHITTQQGQMVSFHAAVHDLTRFIDALDSDNNLKHLEMDDDGQMRAYYHNLSDGYQVGRADFFSYVLTDTSIPEGLHPVSSILPDMDKGMMLVFTDEKGVKRWQLILPTPADRTALLALPEQDSALDKILLHFDAASSSTPGTVSFGINGQEYLGTFDYNVRHGAVPESGGVEFNQVDAERYEVIYPNGDRQYLFLLQ